MENNNTTIYTDPTQTLTDEQFLIFIYWCWGVAQNKLHLKVKLPYGTVKGEICKIMDLICPTSEPKCGNKKQMIVMIALDKGILTEHNRKKPKDA